MVGTIRFPNLGITLTNVIKTFRIGTLSIACYGVVLAFAMMTGLLLVMRVAKATGQKEEDYFDLGVIAIIVAVICARIYYVVFSWDYYRAHIAEIFNLRKGGLAIYGGVAGGVITVLIFCRIRKLNALRALDTASLGLIWGQALGRWGNFFNREAFGDYTDNLLAMQLPVSDVRASEITDVMRAHLQTIDGVEYMQVHPTFLYESLWNLGVLVILLLVTRRMAGSGPGARKNTTVRNESARPLGKPSKAKDSRSAHPGAERPQPQNQPGAERPQTERPQAGTVFFLYLLLYGTGRFWIEGLRTDQLILFGTGLPVSQVLSAILAAASLCILLFRFRFGRRNLYADET